MVKKLFFISILLLILLQTGLYCYDSLTTWDGSIYKDDMLLFDGEKYYFKDNSSEFKIEDISYLQFNMEQSENKNGQSVLGQISPEELLKRADYMTKKYPDASVLVLHDDGVQRLNKDGSHYSRSKYTIKIMNENELSNATLSFYNEEGIYERKIIYARSILPNGTVTYLNPNEIYYTTPTQGLTYFSGKRNAKIIRAVIPNVRVGSIIDYEWESIDMAPEDSNQFYTAWYFNGDNPVYQSDVVFAVPDDKTLYYTLINTDNSKLSITERLNDGFKEYVFSYTESAPVSLEPDSPPFGEILAQVQGSMFKDQTYLSQWLSKFIKERMVVTDEMRNVINQILIKKNAEAEEDKIAVLYRYMQEEIRYLSIKTSLSSGYAGHPAPETFKNKYGDCIDKSIMFASILNDIGIEAYPVIVMTNDQTTPPYGKIGIIRGNHAINEIYLKDGKRIYLDCTSTTHKYPYFRSDDHGIPAWNPLLNKVNFIDFPDSSLNTQIYDFDIILDKKGAGSVKERITYSGDWDAGLRGYFMGKKDKEIISVLYSTVASAYPGSILTGYDYLNPSDYDKNFFLNLEYKADNIAKQADDLLIFEFPVSLDFDFTSYLTRKYPLVFTTTLGKHYKFNIELPDNVKPAGLPDELVIDNKYFNFRCGYSYENNILYTEILYQRKICEVSPTDYREFRSFALQIDHILKTPLVFKTE